MLVGSNDVAKGLTAMIGVVDEAIIAAAELSNRYISDRFLPDKAIDLIDEAAAKLRLEIDSVPEELDEIERRIRQLEIEREAIKRENDTDKLAQLGKEIAVTYGVSLTKCVLLLMPVYSFGEFVSITISAVESGR